VKEPPCLLALRRRRRANCSYGTIPGRHTALGIAASSLLLVHLWSSWFRPSVYTSPAFAKPPPGAPKMRTAEAWKILGLEASTPKGEIKKAYRQKVNQVHPDIVGDGGEKLKQVQEAFKIVSSLEDPSNWVAGTEEAGLPFWATDLLQGIKWSEDCESYAEFLTKPDNKALAVGEINMKTGDRPWAASWGKYNQQDANMEALRHCRAHGTKCRLIYIGSGQIKSTAGAGFSLGATKSESTWWKESATPLGDSVAFGWLPDIDETKEKIVGYKVVKTEGLDGVEKVRVPVFKNKLGTPYYFSPLRPKEKISLKKVPFKRLRSYQSQAASSRSRLRDAYLKLGTEKFADWEQKEKGMVDPTIEAMTPHHVKAAEES